MEALKAEEVFLLMVGKMEALDLLHLSCPSSYPEDETCQAAAEGETDASVAIGDDAVP